MNTIKKLKTQLLAHKAVLGVLAVFALSLGVYAFTGQNLGTVIENQTVQGDFNAAAPTPVVPAFGAFVGPDILGDINIHGSLITGSGTALVTTTDAAAYTLTISDLSIYSYFDIMNKNDNGSGNIAWTLPATSTMNFILSELGSTRSWTFRNASTTGSGTFTLTAGAGIDLVGVTNADDVIDPNEYMEVQCTRIQYRAGTIGLGGSDTNIVCSVNELLAAD